VAITEWLIAAKYQFLNCFNFSIKSYKNYKIQYSITVVKQHSNPVENIHAVEYCKYVLQNRRSWQPVTAVSPRLKICKHCGVIKIS